MTNNFSKKLFLLLFAFMLCLTGYGENLYTIKHSSNKIKLVFQEHWYFSEIRIPVYSPSFWGNELSHNIAVMEIGSEKHVLSRKEKSDYLFFIESAPNIDTNTITVTSINSSTEAAPEQSPYFKAVQSQTKHIEDNLLLIIKKENSDIMNNNCFSCHSLIPTALVINTAQAKGFQIDKTVINNLFISLTNLQNKDGSFFFEKEPCYGKTSTTLSAAYILALLSDNMPTTFVKTGEKINKYLKAIISDTNNKIKADFIFEPFFTSETTALLHEIVFQKSMYLKDNTQYQYCNERANNLLKQTIKHKNDTFIKKLPLLTGIPYSYQLPPNERTAITEEIKSHIQIQSKISEAIRALCLYIYNKISPFQEQQPIFHDLEKEENSAKNIWKCFEKVLYNNPKYLDGNYYESKN